MFCLLCPRWRNEVQFDRKKPQPPREGFLFTMFPHQEAWVRGPFSKNLVQFFRGGSSYSRGSSYTRFLMREHSKWETPPGGVSFDQIGWPRYLAIRTWESRSYEIWMFESMTVLELNFRCDSRMSLFCQWWLFEWLLSRFWVVWWLYPVCMFSSEVKIAFIIARKEIM